MLLIARGWYFSLLNFLGSYLDKFSDKLFMWHIASILQLQYPSALASFEQIMNCAKGKRIALFLDYDGTLSPIVDNPDCAFMSDAVRVDFQMNNMCNFIKNFNCSFLYSLYMC